MFNIYKLTALFVVTSFSLMGCQTQLLVNDPVHEKMYATSVEDYVLPKTKDPQEFFKDFISKTATNKLLFLSPLSQEKKYNRNIVKSYYENENVANPEKYFIENSRNFCLKIGGSFLLNRACVDFNRTGNVLFFIESNPPMNKNSKIALIAPPEGNAQSVEWHWFSEERLGQLRIKYVPNH